jgi:hypothetical protein
MDLIETDNEEENFIGTPPEVTQAAAEATINLLPEKSGYQYERAYNISMNLVCMFKLTFNKKVACFICLFGRRKNIVCNTFYKLLYTLVY